MTRRPGHATSVLMVVGFALAAASFYAGARELLPLLGQGVPQGTKFESYAGTAVPMPLSEASATATLAECYRVSDSVLGRAQPTEKRHALLTACQAAAASITRVSKVNGFAWAIAASMAAELGDEAGFNTFIVKSREVTPNEQWLAELRVELTERNFGIAGPTSRQMEALDLTMLVRSARGIQAIARRYVEQPDFRERVTVVVERLEQDSQRRFLEMVKAASRQVGLGT